jgi:RHS repeat-associated protein
MLLGTTTGYAVSDADLIKDRLGSVQPSYAYGTDTGSGQQTSPGDDFATYWKDSSTGFEYAMNRYYSTGYGRFLTADPFGGSARARNPGSMNRYTYSLSDPVNSVDQSGLCAASYAEICDGGYCPPEVQYCDPGPPGTDYGINDPSQPNCGGNPQFVDGDTGDTLNSGDGCVTPVGTPPNPPQCSISVYERPTPGRWSPGDHTYLYAQDGSVGEYFEGGPTNPIKNLFGNYGTLWGFDSLNPATNLNGRSPLSGDNTSTNTWLGSWSGAEACVDIGLISFWISVYDNGPQPKYHPLWGYNSNSFTYTLLYQLGLAGDFQPIGWAPDWGKLVPGL